MGRSGGGPSPWRRWPELGARALVLVCRQKRQQQPSSILCKEVFGVFEVKGRVQCVVPLPHVQQHRILSERSSFTAVLSPSAKSTSFGNGSPNLLYGAQNRSMEMEMFGTAANSKRHPPYWLHQSRVLEIHNCGHPRRMFAASAGDPAGAEQPSKEFVNEEPAYPIFPSHSHMPTSVKTIRRGVAGVSIASTILDPGIDMPFMSRSSKLPLHSALPSLRSHRLGETTLLGLHGVEATASMPAGEAVDWQQQRLGRLRDYDPRSRPQQSSSPHSDAEPDDIFIPVKAFYISRSVDLKSLAREPFLEVTSSRNNLIIRCADRPPHSPVTADNPEMACLGFLKERYMVAFQYGSVVFFNFGDLEEVESLDVVRKYCSDEFWEARKDDYGVLVRPTLPEWSEGGHDRVMLRKLDIDNIRVISSILGQSIALDHYAKKVDEMVTTFSELNRGMEQTGTFTMTRKSLFQLVAAANTTLADVILRLGLLERSDAAWKDANYAQIWEYLRDDFELDDRFESLDFKLNIIQHNVRFFLDILQNRKSDTLEWIIILLITGEICVSLYDILHSAGVF